MNRAAYGIVSLLIATGLVVLFAYLVNGKYIPVLDPSGDIAAAQRNLFIFTVGLSALVVIPVFGMLAYICVKYREGNHRSKYRPEWGENNKLEALWWGIPIAIIGVLAVVTYQTSHSLDPYKPIAGKEPLNVQVVALRWKWLFLYPEQQVASLNHVYIPNDRPVKFTMTADAPMSAFWIPSLGSQIYAMNGMQSELNLKGNQTGVYTGYTTNINGEGYAKMTFATHVVEADEFSKWSAATTKSVAQMDMKKYEALAEPSSMTQQQTYKLSDRLLFNTIVAQYEHSHGASNDHMEHSHE